MSSGFGSSGFAFFWSGDYLPVIFFVRFSPVWHYGPSAPFVDRVSTAELHYPIVRVFPSTSFETNPFDPASPSKLETFPLSVAAVGTLVNTSFPLANLFRLLG